MHQLTPNAIVRLSVFIWATRSQGVRTEADAFYRVHDLHYHTKVRASDGLHNNFGCFTFTYQKDTVARYLHIEQNGMATGQKNGFMLK